MWIHIGTDGNCSFGLLGTSFSIIPAGNFSRLSVGDNGEHIFGGDGSGQVATGNIVWNVYGQLTVNSLIAPNDIEITDTAKGYILKSPGGSRYRIKVADDGTLSTEVP